MAYVLGPLTTVRSIYQSIPSHIPYSSRCLKACVAFTVQCFYAWRVKVLTRNRWIVGAILLFSFVQLGESSEHEFLPFTDTSACPTRWRNCGCSSGYSPPLHPRPAEVCKDLNHLVHRSRHRRPFDHRDPRDLPCASMRCHCHFTVTELAHYHSGGRRQGWP